MAPRTALEPATPLALVDPGRDDWRSFFFPLVYWPFVPAPEAAAGAINRTIAYMKQGGTVLFDTLDEVDPVPWTRRIPTPASLALAQHPRSLSTFFPNSSRQREPY